MALALVLFVSLVCAVPGFPVARVGLIPPRPQSASSQSGPDNAQNGAATSQIPAQKTVRKDDQQDDQQNPPARNSGGTAKPAPKSAATSSSKKARQSPASTKKPSASANCDPALTSKTGSTKSAPGSGKSGSASSNTAPTKPSTGAKPTAGRAAANCPPTKVIVRQGGTTDPSIELVGGAAGTQATDERHNANKLLQSTENNLRKIENQQLDSDQKEIVNHVRQFMQQSREATAAGDVDEATTLAQKAQLLSQSLSDELGKPQK